MSGSIEIAPFVPADAAAGHALTTAFAWPHRLEDWHLLAEVGRGLVARTAAGEVIGTALWWPYGPGAAAVGMVLVSSSAQGRGIGRRLMAAILAQTGERALMLNATPAGLKLYEDLAFRTIGHIAQHQGEVDPPGGTPIGRPARAGDHEALIALDAAAFGAPRRALMTRLLALAEARVIEEGGRAVAFALRRESGRGEVVGPIVARDEDEAAALVRALAVPGFVRADNPAEASRLGEALAAIGMPRVDGATVMVKGEWAAATNAVRRFGLVSQALG